MTSPRRKVMQTLLGLAVVLLALGAWEVWSSRAGSFTVPEASAVLATAADVWPSQDFLAGVAASLGRLAAGFLIGAATGVALGLLIGASGAARSLLEPLVELGRATPIIAIVPAFMVLLGFGDAMRISVIAFAVCFPVLVSTFDGVRRIPPELDDTASMLHVGRIERILRVHLPGSLPSIAAGLRVAVSLGLIAVVISEFVGEGDGLGSYIWLQYNLVDIEALYAGLLFLGLLGVVLNRLFVLGERRLLSWHHGAVGDPR
jgi:ABC-type nitrate/sulfonate/bicarbonate transport system permease component